jgi:hypothetical protein
MAAMLSSCAASRRFCAGFSFGKEEVDVGGVSFLIEQSGEVGSVDSGALESEAGFVDSADVGSVDLASPESADCLDSAESSSIGSVDGTDDMSVVCGSAMIRASV